MSVLSSDKIDKYEYLTGKERLPSDQSILIGQAKFTCFALGKALKNQAKAIEDQGEKSIKAIENRVEKLILETDQEAIYK